MSKDRWLSLATASLLFFFAAAAAPHTVHHFDQSDCPVLAAAHQANGELSDDFSLSIQLPWTHDVPIFDPILHEKSTYPTCRNRAPPVIQPA